MARPDSAAPPEDRRNGSDPLWQRYGYLTLLPAVQEQLLRASVAVPNLLGATSEPRADLQQFVGEIARVLPKTERGARVAAADAATVARELASWMLGLGLLTPYLEDPTVNDVVVHGCLIDVRRCGRRETVGRLAAPAYFVDLMSRVCQVLGEDIHARKLVGVTGLPDGSRLTVMFPPLSVTGPTVYVRRHVVRRLSLDELCASGTLDLEGAELLKRLAGRASIVVSGAPGSGKTTLLNAVTAHLPPLANVGLVETFREVQPQTPRVAHLVAEDYDTNEQHSLARLVNSFITRTLVDVLIVGEVTGEEAAAWVDGAGIGVPAMTTTHGRSPMAALLRLEGLCQAARPDYPHTALRERIADSVDLVVQMQRSGEGAFRVAEIVEVDGLEPGAGRFRMRSLQRYDAPARRFTRLVDTAPLLARLGLE